jgi:excisionase family DNA binding protein
MEPRFLKASDIAKDLDVAEDTVREWIRTKQLPAYKMGREYRIKREDYEAFLAQRRTTNDLLDSGEGR